MKEFKVFIFKFCDLYVVLSSFILYNAFRNYNYIYISVVLKIIIFLNYKLVTSTYLWVNFEISEQLTQVFNFITTSDK